MRLSAAARRAAKNLRGRATEKAERTDEKSGAGADGEAYSPFYRSVPRLDTRQRVG